MSVVFVISNFLNVCHTENCEARDLSICSNRLDLKKKYRGMFDKKGGWGVWLELETSYC